MARQPTEQSTTAIVTGTSTPNNNLPPTVANSSNVASERDFVPATNAHEMSVLDQSKTPGAASQSAGAGAGLLNDISIPESSPIDTTSFSSLSGADMAGDENTRPEHAAALSNPASAAIISNEPLSTSNNEASTTSTVPASTPPPQPPAQVSRVDSLAIGPSTGEAPIAPIVSHSVEAGPVLVITLLLTSGARHPYKIDERYLTKRNVNVPGVTAAGRKDPYTISVYTLKELILREWRDEWEAQPSSPSSIRLIYFGRLLDDNTPLKDCRFNEKEANVVHMTVRPQDIVDEEDASKSKGGRDRDGNESTAGCRCIMM
ncbi:hypothetical protein LOCC1_G003676 [Lachnellula occidentalis]|uniref:Ubiquitin-like domain-containing protein n=1 Tax=Lachnellula occidentalis TaxID=215460 RepID=A0A8H8S4Q7_9HELO|nr:hypothetical protein LOCC1_G003676 [Lachnellula occidentalis]